MKIKELLIIKDSLVNLAKILLPNPIDNYNIFKMYVEVEKELKNYNIQKDKIVMKYAKKDSNSIMSITTDNPNYNKALSMLTELGEIEVNLNLDKIILSVNDLNLSAIDLYNLIEFKIIELKI